MTYYVVTLYDELGTEILKTKFESISQAKEYLFQSQFNPETAAGKLEMITEIYGTVVASNTIDFGMWKPVQDEQLQTEYYRRG